MHPAREQAERLLKSELDRIAEAKQKLQAAREEEALGAARKRLAKRAAEAGRKQTTTRARKRVSITSHTHADGHIEYLDPRHPEAWSREAREAEAAWADIDRRRSRNGIVISAVCNEPVRIR